MWLRILIKLQHQILSIYSVENICDLEQNLKPYLRKVQLKKYKILREVQLKYFEY